MANEQPADNTPAAEPSPALRNRLQKLFEHATKRLQAGDTQIPPDLLQECVQGDPGNNLYVQNFLAALKKKFNIKKGEKPSALRGSGLRSQVKAAQKKKEWRTVLNTGTEGLKQNPWDLVILMAMGEACQNLKYEDCELSWLHMAREAHPKDLDLNRQCAKALTRRGLYDQAIYCWHAVEREKPEDQEALSSIAELSVERTKHKGNPVTVKKEETAERKVNIELTPEQKLEKALRDNPALLDAYLELAELYIKSDRLDRAESTLQKGLEASGNEVRFQEKLEDVGLLVERRRVGIAERRAVELNTLDAKELAKRLKQELTRREIDYHRGRLERYPNSGLHKYELGRRLKKEGQYPQATALLQEAVADAKVAAPANLELGECLQYAKQYEPALQAYETAVAGFGDKAGEGLKLALYRAGVLAMGLKMLERAKSHLQKLATLDPNYRDLRERLDKLA